MTTTKLAIRPGGLVRQVAVGVRMLCARDMACGEGTCACRRVGELGTAIKNNKHRVVEVLLQLRRGDQRGERHQQVSCWIYFCDEVLLLLRAL